jgi:RecA-family ATPase
MIVAGKYVVLGGPGGVSKTMLALGLAVQIALGQSWASRPVLQGLSMLFLGEEDSEEVYRRLNAVARNLTPTDWPSIMNCVRAFPAAGKDIRLVHLQGDNPEATGFDSDIIALADEFAAQQACPVRLIVIDHARLALSGNLNDAAHVTELTRQLTNIAVVTGAAVMLLAHSPKSTLGKQEETNAADIAGSAAFVDNSRCTMVVTTLRADEGKALGIPETACSSYARLMVVKNNYGATGTKIYFHRRYDADFQVAPLEPVTLQPVPKAIASAALTVGIINAVTAHPGRWSRTGFTKHNSGCKGKLAASERDIAAEVDRLINSGRLALRAPTENERIDHNLSHNVREVLVPGNGGSESKVRGET